MYSPKIRKVAVLGAGVMGAQIAAHLINAKIPVVLFDLCPGPETGASNANANAIAQKALDHLKTLRPAPFGLHEDAQFIELANYDEDLDKLKTCDWVIEAVAERLDLKHGLYQKVMPAIAEHAIFTSNTSGLSITALASILTEDLKSRFCGIHFFNPPRYMHLVELIPTQETRADLLDCLEIFLTSTLGKGVVRAKDTPNFIANRVGVFSMLSVIAEAQKFGLRFDLVDDLTGRRLGRAKSATFRTADIVGLDTMAYVIETMHHRLADDPFFALYQTPTVLANLIKQGALGQKSGAGFYKKEGKTIKVLNLQGDGYSDSGKRAHANATANANATADALIDRILKRDPAERLKLLRKSTHPQAQFLWAIFRDLFHYSAVHLEAIADNARNLDLAIRWGFGWDEGPFESWQAAGWQQVAEWINEDIEAGSALAQARLPDWVFHGPVADQRGVHSAQGAYSPATQLFVPRSTLPVYNRQVFRAPLAGESDPLKYGQTLVENDAVRIWADTRTGEDDVVIISFKTKLNTISTAVLDGLSQAIDLAEKDYQGVVVWQPSSLKLGSPGGPFSAGADLKSMMPAFMKGGAKGIEPIVSAFQQTMLRVKYANVPVVSAISGLALGGGCELALASAARVAHFESYMGLVEAGVGLLPAGGGLKEAALRAAQRMQRTGGTDLIEYLAKPFENIGMAKVSGSALEAQAMGYLELSDTIVFNVYELLDAAKRQVRTLAAAGWRAPWRARAIVVAGRPGIATFKMQLVNLRDGGFISAHDFLIGSRIAETLCGGDVESGSLVDEDWLLALERHAFIELLTTQKNAGKNHRHATDG